MTERIPASTESIETPVGRTAWAEARPPHLPDTVTRVPRLVWPFLALAAFEAYLGFQQLSSPFLSLDQITTYVLAAFREVTVPLLGAAFFARHRDGWQAHRAVAIAVILLALERFLRSTSGFVTDLIDPIDPDPFLTAEGVLVMGYRFLIAMAGVVASAFLALGLHRARRRPDARATRAVTIALLAIAIAIVVATILQYGLALSQMHPDAFLAMNILALVSYPFSVVAATVVTTELLAGARAGERPRWAWRVGAMSGTLTLVLLVLGAAVHVDAGTGQWLAGVYLGAVTWITITASLLLLAAFVLGLPSDDRDETLAAETT